MSFKRRVFVWLRRIAFAALALELLYVLAAAWFLNFDGLALAFAGTNQVNAKVGSGWSVIPGRAHVRNVRVTFQDKNLQFVITAERVSLVVHMSELLEHRFHGSHVHGEGLSFRMRHRVDPWSKNDPAVGTFPPIPEFAAPAVFEAFVPEPPIPDDKYNLWTIHLDDVDVGVSEVWAQAFRYQGKGRAKGKFQLKPARELWVGPASLELEPGLLSAGGYRVAPGFHGRIDCIVYPFDVRPPVGMEPFRWVSARVRFDAPELDPQVYALFAGEPSTRVSSQSGTLHLDLETKRGVITPQSELHIVQRGFELRAGQGDLETRHLELHAGAEGPSFGYATLLIEGGTLKESIAPGHPPRIERLSVTAVSKERDVARPFELHELRLGEARIALGDAAWLNRWLKNQRFSMAGGGVSLMARGVYKDELLNAELLAESNGVAARLDQQPLRYAGTLSAKVEQGNFERMTGKVTAELTGKSLRAELSSGVIDLADLQARVMARRDEHESALHGEARLYSLSGKTKTGFTVVAPEVRAVVSSKQVAGQTEVTRFLANVPSLRAEGRGVRLTTAATARGTLAQNKEKTAQNLDFEATLLKPRARFESRVEKIASTDKVEVRAKVSSDAAGILNGQVSLLPAPWRIDSGNIRVAGKSAVLFDLEALDLTNNRGVLATHVSATAVSLGSTTQDADCPWSRVQLVELEARTELLEEWGSTVRLKGELGQTELSWGDFTTRADIGLAAHFDAGLLSQRGNGTFNVSLRHASLQSGSGKKEGWAAQVPTLDLAAQLQRRNGKLAGEAKVNAPEAKARIGETTLKTDLSAELDLSALDLIARTARATGAVHLRKTSLPNVADPVSNWWADVNLDTLFGHADENLELGGTFRANLRDATPGLAVLAAQGSLPKWVASAFPLRGLSVTGSMARRCRLTDIHLVNVSGGPAVARGRLQSVPDGFQGALLMRLSGLGAISAGVEFDARHTSFGLFDGDDWLASYNKEFDRQSEKAVKLECPPDPDRCNEPDSMSVASSDH